MAKRWNGDPCANAQAPSGIGNSGGSDPDVSVDGRGIEEPQPIAAHLLSHHGVVCDLRARWERHRQTQVHYEHSLKSRCPEVEKTMLP
jgi:hypothetical protein